MLKCSETNCPFEDEIVSYMYDEMAGPARLKFETHLSDCIVCTDEFAAISEARFATFEWRKEEFAHLPTPEIVIPYESTRKVEERASIGFFEGLRGWLQPLPLAAAAGLIVVLSVSFFMVGSGGSADQLVASGNIVQPVEVPDTTAVQKPASVVQAPEIARTTAVKTDSKEIRPVKAVVRRQTVNVKQETATNTKPQKPSVVATTAPVLSTAFEAEDDNSLRLADLLADLDS